MSWSSNWVPGVAAAATFIAALFVLWPRRARTDVAETASWAKKVGAFIVSVGLGAGIVLPMTCSRVLAYDRPECPHDWTDTSYVNRGFPASGELGISGSLTAVPEYHDCQRFLVRHGTLGFDSLQAVFVRHGLDTLFATGAGAFSPATPPAFLQGGALTAPIPGPNGNILLSSWLAGMPTAKPRLLTIGIVYSEGEYPSLGMIARFQCLVLLWTPGDVTETYVAWMVPVEHERDCMDESKLKFAGTTPFPGTSPLSGIQTITTYSGTSSSTYIGYVYARRLYVSVIHPAPSDKVPPVARWDWDERREEHYIGIACPTGWCEVTTAPQPDSRTSPRYSAPTAYPGNQGAVARVKGYYDEQYLARASGWKDGRDGAFGTIYPVPRYSPVTLTQYTTATDTVWYAAARMSLSLPSVDYADKLNLDKVSARDPMAVSMVAPGLTGSYNELALCFEPTGATGKCVPSGTAALLACVPATDPDGTWYGRITSAMGAGEKFYCATRRKMPPDHDVPPVVRWRWHPKDDTVWVPCASGCCEVEVRCGEEGCG